MSEHLKNGVSLSWLIDTKNEKLTFTAYTAKQKLQSISKQFRDKMH